MVETAMHDDHEKVVTITDPESGLRAVIAIHSTALGPALGGIRCWTYPDMSAATHDAMRLAQGMTYKNALAGLPLGGGKSVILGGSTAKTPSALHAFASAIERLNGQYIGAEDVGTTVADIDFMRDVTGHVAGTSWGAAASGDPSPHTAEGVFVGMQAALEAVYGSDSMEDCRIGILGLGNVGWKLAEKLSRAGAALLVADLDSARVAAAEAEFGAQAFAPHALPYAPMDVFAPCALGGALTTDFAEGASAGIICGAANNQLAEPSVDAVLWDAGKLYAPDYLVNAGGVMNVAAEALGEYDAYRVATQVRGIRETARDCFIQAKRTDTPTGAIADALALDRIKATSAAA